MGILVPTTLQNLFSLTLPWLYRTKWIIFLTNLFTQNNNVGFQLLAITLETRAAEKVQKWRHKWSVSEAEKFLNCCTQLKFFSASLLTFAPWYFDFPWLPLTIGTIEREKRDKAVTSRSDISRLAGASGFSPVSSISMPSFTISFSKKPTNVCRLLAMLSLNYNLYIWLTRLIQTKSYHNYCNVIMNIMLNTNKFM